MLAIFWFDTHAPLTIFRAPPPGHPERNGGSTARSSMTQVGSSCGELAFPPGSHELQALGITEDLQRVSPAPPHGDNSVDGRSTPGPRDGRAPFLNRNWLIPERKTGNFPLTERRRPGISSHLPRGLGRRRDSAATDDEGRPRKPGFGRARGRRRRRDSGERELRRTERRSLESAEHCLPRGSEKKIGRSKKSVDEPGAANMIRDPNAAETPHGALPRSLKTESYAHFRRI